MAGYYFSTSGSQEIFPQINIKYRKKDAKKYDITILPPDVTLSYSDFRVIVDEFVETFEKSKKKKAVVKKTESKLELFMSSIV